MKDIEMGLMPEVGCVYGDRIGRRLTVTAFDESWVYGFIVSQYADNPVDYKATRSIFRNHWVVKVNDV